jgi:hypothetical protein
MDIYRIDLEDYSHRHVKQIHVFGSTRSNILEDEIAGCVLSPLVYSTMRLCMVNWKTGQYAIIDTGIPVNSFQCSVLLSRDSQTYIVNH